MAPPSEPTPPDLNPPRKHRRVATRSCQLCRQRKQRCELPDTEVEDSTAPLSPDKACHRCSVLQVDCVVDDRGTLKYAPARRQRRKQEAGQAQLPASPNPTMHDAGPSRHDHIDESDIMRTFEPYHYSHARTILEDARGVDRSENGLRYHGRPQSITSVMIHLASRRGATEQVSPELQSLETLYPKLLIFHPYLPDWPEIIAGDDPGSRLRRHLVAYLLLSKSDLAQGRHELALEITRLRNHILRTLPRSEATLHSLLILSQIAPLGALPSDRIGDISVVGRQRGLHLACQHLVDSIAPSEAFARPVTWTRLQHHSNALAESLEEDPPSPFERWALGRSLFDDPNLAHYAQDECTARAIGKLEILERVVRLEIVHLAVLQIQEVSDNQTIADTLSRAVKELESVNDRLSAIIASLNIDITSGLGETWMSYRNVGYQYHLGKLYRTAIRTYIATAFQQGPEPAHDLACDPQNVHLFFTADPPWPARQYILPVLVARVQAIGPLLQHFIALNPTGVLPWHQIICMAVDTCNVIMEIQAGTLAFGEVDNPDISRNFRLQEWAQLKKMLGTISANLQVADPGARTLGDVAAKLMGAMVRVMEGRIMRFARERAVAQEHNDAAVPVVSRPADPVPHEFGLSLGFDQLSDTLPASTSPSEFSPAELDQMFAEIFNTTYPDVEWLNMDEVG